MKRNEVLIAAACLLCITAPVLAAGKEETKSDYMAAFMAGKKIGYIAHTRQVADGKVTTTEEMVITIARMNVQMTMKQAEIAIETAEGKPLGFRSVQDLGLTAQTIEGTVDKDGKVQVTISSGPEKRSMTLDWPAGALLAEGMRRLTAAKGLKEGTKYTAKAFSPALLKALEAEISVGAETEADLLGRVVRLTEVKTVLKAPTGEIETTSYVDKNLDALKTVVPMMGMKLEMIACSKEFATAPGDVMDFFDKVVVSSPSPLGDVRSAASVAYSIQPAGKDAKLEFLTTPSQKVAREPDSDTVVVTVAPLRDVKGGAIPYKGTDPAAAKALKPTRFLQSDEKEIADLAKEAVGDAKDAAEAARRVESFVGRYVENKNLSVGYATALEVARSKQGDCSEHAVLAAAMCRAAGIPAQVVAGMAYVGKLGEKPDVFVPHAWFRAMIGERWVDFDAALRGFSAGHIALCAGDGDPDDFFAVLGTMGNFRIVKAVKP